MRSALCDLLLAPWSKENARSQSLYGDACSFVFGWVRCTTVRMMHGFRVGVYKGAHEGVWACIEVFMRI